MCLVVPGGQWVFHRSDGGGQWGEGGILGTNCVLRCDQPKGITMIVGMWMTRNLVCVQPDTPLREAASLMRDNRIRRLPVVARKGDELSLLGIVSATDIYRAYPAHCNPFAADSEAQAPATTAGEVMSTSVLTTTPDTPLEDAA